MVVAAAASSLINAVVVVATVVAATSSSPLDCDFIGDCCWATTQDSKQWEVHSADEIDINEFRRTFLVGKSRPPPEGNYAIRVERKRRSSLASCAICSADAVVTVKLRHWQNADASLKLCWQGDGGDVRPATATNSCVTTKHAKQSTLNSYRLRVEPRKNFRLVLTVENANANRGDAVVIVDRIAVAFTACDSAERRIKSVLTSQLQVEPSPNREQNASLVGKSRKKNKQRKTTLAKLARQDERVKAKLAKIEKERQALSEADRAVAKAVDQIDRQSLGLQGKKLLEASHAQKPKSLPLAQLAASADGANPLNDLLGKEFVNFLDPNYVSEDNDEPEDEVEESKPKPTITPPNPARSKSIVHQTASQNVAPPKEEPEEVSASRFLQPKQPITVEPAPLFQPRLPPLAVPTPCETTGGCLFERTLCQWSSASSTPPASRFQIQKVGLSSFAQAIVPVGVASVFEAATLMVEPHTVLFDVLEFRLGTRLVGCCVSASRLHCPFATSSEASAVVWQFAKFECPAQTTKISFICENLGVEEGVCGIDNVRVHRADDVLLLEPCQKSLLPSL